MLLIINIIKLLDLKVIQYIQNIFLKNIEILKYFLAFSWNNVNSNTKSFMIELIEDDINKKWQVINIPKESRKIIENEEIIGETTIEYKGISDNASCALFILYEINKEKITLEEANDKEKLKELVLYMAFIEVY